MAIDHEKLLAKYIGWVETCEGMTYISRLEQPSLEDEKLLALCFSHAEVAELKRLEALTQGIGTK